MGIYHSAHGASSSDSESLSPHVVERKHSVAFSHLASTAISGRSQETIVNHSEKGLPAQSEGHYVPLPPPLYNESIATADLVQGDSANA